MWMYAILCTRCCFLLSNVSTCFSKKLTFHGWQWILRSNSELRNKGVEEISGSKISVFTARSLSTTEIARVGGHYAVQGHSRSLILIPIESPYKTSYWWIIAYIQSRTVFHWSRSICQIVTFDEETPLVNVLNN